MEDSDLLQDANCHLTVRKSHHSEKLKSNLISRLNRIEGQIRGVKGMHEVIDELLKTMNKLIK
jgi:CsoR family transcriptional regulator, copper-sensing transcriptional repressor